MDVPILAEEAEGRGKKAKTKGILKNSGEPRSSSSKKHRKQGSGSSGGRHVEISVEPARKQRSSREHAWFIEELHFMVLISNHSSEHDTHLLSKTYNLIC